MGSRRSYGASGAIAVDGQSVSVTEALTWRGSKVVSRVPIVLGRRGSGRTQQPRYGAKRRWSRNDFVGLG